MIHPIRYYGDPILRRVAKPITSFDDNLAKLVDDMVETVYDANGIGLAAPQIGVSVRLFLALETTPLEEDERNYSETTAKEEKRELWGVQAEHILVNPEIIEHSGTQVGPDGCLSVPGLFYETMERWDTITVNYQKIDGPPTTMKASGRLAHIIQHETDHLNGILFFDRLSASQRAKFKDEYRSELAEMQRHSKLFIKSLTSTDGKSHWY